MVAHYDTYDYPSYWEGREYEHLAEVRAIKAFLSKIPKINILLEIGSGYGRLAPFYMHRARKVILTDPSSKLLSLARKNIKDKRVKFTQSTAENLPKKIKPKSVDLVLCVRVIHHIKDVDEFIYLVHKILKKKGYFILEFANKRHFKALISELVKGNLTFPLDIFPKDIRTKKSKRECNLPFVNYHPDEISKKLKDRGFKILKVRSVSNIRSAYLKKHFSTQALLQIEDLLQEPAAKFYLGPSIFVLAQKVG